MKELMACKFDRDHRVQCNHPVHCNKWPKWFWVILLYEANRTLRWIKPQGLTKCILQPCGKLRKNCRGLCRDIYIIFHHISSMKFQKTGEGLILYCYLRSSARTSQGTAGRWVWCQWCGCCWKGFLRQNLLAFG